MIKKNYVPSICVYAITKNEEQFAKKWADNMSEADYVVVLDTGSTDKTVDILISSGVQVETKEIIPWRFDVARNESMKLIPKGTDICVCTDLDELFEPGWANVIRANWKKDTEKLKYLYSWSHNEQGDSQVEIWYEKIHDNSGNWYWAMPVHEAITHKTKKLHEINTITIPGKLLHLHHYPDLTKSRGNYLGLMELALKEEPENITQNWYYGRELYFHKKYEDSVKQLEKLKNLGNGGFQYQRAGGLMFLGHAYFAIGDLINAETNYVLATLVGNDVRDPYIQLAHFYYTQNRWYACIDTCIRALNIGSMKVEWYEDSHNYKELPHDYLSIAYYNIGDFSKSLEQINIALKFSPNNERLLSNKEFTLNAIK